MFEGEIVGNGSTQFIGEWKQETGLEETLILSEFVRRHYCDFLQRQLEENVRTWSRRAQNNTPTHRQEGEDNCVLLLLPHIRECTSLLEERAILACRMTKLYQNAMTNIIAGVRRQTKDHRLVEPLQQKLLPENGQAMPASTRSHHSKANALCSRATQTDDLAEWVFPGWPSPKVTSEEEATPPFSELPLDHRIALMQKDHAQQQQQQKEPQWSDAASTTPPAGQSIDDHSVATNPAEGVPPSPPCTDEPDSIARELAQLFADDDDGERDEFDNLFGCGAANADDEMDDPQMQSILREIRNAPQPKGVHKVATPKTQSPRMPHQAGGQAQPAAPPPTVDLRRSLWPCELYEQRRRLADCLSQCEDFRWQEAVRWKFNELFGEDSEDEWATFSPSIDLDAVLVNSCIRRITPWLIRHLMGALNERLIANRFLFKKLAKRLACTIIAENQYPDERFIKCKVEEFFCTFGAVSTLNDIDNSLPPPSFYHYVD